MIAVVSCKKKKSLSDLNIENLYKVNTLKISDNNNNLNITLFDDSYIYFEDYNELKFNVFINDNFDILKEYESVKITSTQKGRDDIYNNKYYNKDLKKIKDKFSNKYLKRNLYLVVSSFNASELWNFRSTTIQFSNRIKDKKKLNYIELLTRHSDFQNGNRKDSIATKRIELMKEFFSEEGIQDAWDKNNKRIDASNLVLNLNLILNK